jgi:hypothetical protein
VTRSVFNISILLANAIHSIILSEELFNIKGEKGRNILIKLYCTDSVTVPRASCATLQTCALGLPVLQPDPGRSL